MIEETRSYFKKIIRQVDSDLKHDGSLDDKEQIGLTALDRTYKLYFGQLKPETIDSTIESELPVEVVIYRKIGSNAVEDFDRAFCKAIDIHALAQNRKMYDQEQVIKRVECDSITPEEIDTDDKTYRFVLQFTVTLSYVYNI